MPYTVTIALFDFVGFFSSAFPTMLGSIFSPPPPSGSTGVPVDTAINAPGTLTLSFTSAAVPPAGVSAMLIRETTVAGDLFRSGSLGAYPPSPATLTMITAPTVTIPAATLAATAAGAAPVTFVVPTDTRVLAGFLSGGMIIPLTLTIATVALVTGPPITVTVTGTLVARQGIFFVITHRFTLTVTFAAGLSGDPTDPSRILSITAATSTLHATGIPGLVTAAVAPSIGSAIASALESAVNGTIAAMAPGALATAGMMLTPTARISALRLTITGSGVGLALVLGDLFGPGVVPIPGNLSVSVTPQPEQGKLHTYVFTITNSANGAPVAGATAVLTNYSAQGTKSVSTKTSDASGHVTFTTTLHNKIVQISSHATGLPDTIVTSPTLQVSASGFNSLVIALLGDD